VSEFLWISEADVIAAMDIAKAVRAVEAALRAEGRGDAKNMQKTHVAWDGGTLHAIGATFPDFVGTKTWAHTESGATPLLILYDRASGSLKAVIEAFALGQMRTGAVSGVATRYLAREEAGEMAIIGTGKQALPQVAAVAVVRPLKRVRVYSRTEEHRLQFANRIRDELGIDAVVAASLSEAVKEAPIITTVTRAREPFLTAAMVTEGAHINAVGAIVPAGGEIAHDLVGRCNRIVVDSVPQAQKLSSELKDVKWDDVQSLSTIVAERPARANNALTLFKALGMGISDLALGIEIYRRAIDLGLGRPLPHPERAAPTRRAYTFIDRTGGAESRHRPYQPVVITREEIDAEIARLAALPAPSNGRRVSMIANPAAGVGNGLAPGIAVSLSVLKPGERTRPIRHNTSLINFCIRGRGSTIVDGKRIRFSQYDAWNIPPWAVYQHVNDSDELHVRLTYSNSALLEKLNVHVTEEDPLEERSDQREIDEDAQPNPFGTLRITEEGALLMPYEKLINPDVVRMEALHWPWKRVKEELDKLTALGSSYVGRRLYLLYNPATGRTNGTSHTFFATICLRPAKIVDRPHRHTASAINYFFKGSGSSVIEGKRHDWKAGDLMLTAPGWAIHNHSSHDEDVYELTIQDSPLQIAMGSLLWQEDLSRPPEVLGATGGFATNRPPQGVGR
jgi:ornithine cyclodeaminase/alanine dehydrogenase-like protein (mu-crystallin family)/gentisate 1,2-dioxygenase